MIADLELFNAGDELVLACDPSRRDDVLATLVRSRFRRKVELEPSGHSVVSGDADGALATLDTPIGPYRWSPAARRPWRPGGLGDGARRGRYPAYGREFDGDTMPAEAGLDERAVSFSKGCYPGQEPVARLRYRGHPNRVCAGSGSAGDARPRPRPTSCSARRRRRVTSPVMSPTHGSIALAVLRREVPDEAEVDAGGVAGVVKALPFAAAMA